MNHPRTYCLRLERTSLVLAASLCAGCWRPPAATIEQSQRGLVWMLPGIQGGAWQLAGPYRALRKAGVHAEIRVYDWERPFNSLANLTEYQRNRTRAADIAAAIAQYHTQHPGAPVDLVGYSGGGGLVVMVAEALPPDVRLRHLVLVHAAISPDYDLTAALRRVDGKLINFYSPLDWWTLGAGTSVFGTMDRKYVASAGHVGLNLQRAAPPELHGRIEQVCWRGEMIASGHLGNHLGMVSEEWNRRYVAPHLLSTAGVERRSAAAAAE